MLADSAVPASVAACAAAEEEEEQQQAVVQEVELQEAELEQLQLERAEAAEAAEACAMMVIASVQAHKTCYAPSSLGHARHGRSEQPVGVQVRPRAKAGRAMMCRGCMPGEKLHQQSPHPAEAPRPQRHMAHRPTDA